MKIHESGENYLETIFILKQRNGSVRSIDIAHELNYSKPSVSRAVGILRREGYITVDADGNIELTNKGKKLAGDLYERHTLIAEYLIEALAVDREIAALDACRIEHIISAEAFGKMKEWLQAKA
jgi:Mn-dependent DtxR family transcriptional regulator